MSKENKYRIVEALAKDEDGIWYAPERLERFLFWPYWFGWTHKVYPTIAKAHDKIDRDKFVKKFKEKVVKQVD